MTRTHVLFGRGTAAHCRSRQRERAPNNGKACPRRRSTQRGALLRRTARHCRRRGCVRGSGTAGRRQGSGLRERHRRARAALSRRERRRRRRGGHRRPAHGSRGSRARRHRQRRSSRALRRSWKWRERPAVQLRREPVRRRCGQPRHQARRHRSGRVLHRSRRRRSYGLRLHQPKGPANVPQRRHGTIRAGTEPPAGSELAQHPLDGGGRLRRRRRPRPVLRPLAQPVEPVQAAFALSVAQRRSRPLRGRQPSRADPPGPRPALGHGERAVLHADVRRHRRRRRSRPPAGRRFRYQSNPPKRGREGFHRPRRPCPHRRERNGRRGHRLRPRRRPGLVRHQHPQVREAFRARTDGQPPLPERRRRRPVRGRLPSGRRSRGRLGLGCVLGGLRQRRPSGSLPYQRLVRRAGSRRTVRRWAGVHGVRGRCLASVHVERRRDVFGAVRRARHRPPRTGARRGLRGLRRRRPGGHLHRQPRCGAYRLRQCVRQRQPLACRRPRRAVCQPAGDRGPRGRPHRIGQPDAGGAARHRLPVPGPPEAAFRSGSARHGDGRRGALAGSGAPGQPCGEGRGGPTADHPPAGARGGAAERGARDGKRSPRRGRGDPHRGAGGARSLPLQPLEQRRRRRLRRRPVAPNDVHHARTVR